MLLLLMAFLVGFQITIFGMLGEISSAFRLHQNNIMDMVVDPRGTIVDYCKSKLSEVESSKKRISCFAKIYWRQKNTFQSPCKSQIHSYDFPKRYYLFELSCSISIEKLKGNSPHLILSKTFGFL